MADQVAAPVICAVDLHKVYTSEGGEIVVLNGPDFTTVSISLNNAVHHMGVSNRGRCSTGHDPDFIAAHPVPYQGAN